MDSPQPTAFGSIFGIFNPYESMNHPEIQATSCYPEQRFAPEILAALK